MGGSMGAFGGGGFFKVFLGWAFNYMGVGLLGIYLYG